ncbi:MAG: hypothetical protein WA969_00565, partial [Candidatus Microthrix parvicella]
IGPTLAALRTSRRAPRMDTGTLRAELDLTDLDRLSPRDQDAVVAWAALWARRGGERNVTADVSITSDGHVEMVVFDPDGDTPAGPMTVKLFDLGAPIEVTTPPITESTPLR